MSRVHSLDERRKLHAVRVAGVVFLIAASLVFFFGLGGTHSHGELFVSAGSSEVRLPGSRPGGEERAEPVIAAGELRFRLASASNKDHEFAVFKQSGEGETLAGSTVAGMNSDGPALQLTPGRYRIVCTTPGHESQGMSYGLRVE